MTPGEGLAMLAGALLVGGSAGFSWLLATRPRYHRKGK